MTKDEFVETACSTGYCTKKQAEEYSKDRETFTDDDFIEVYRMADSRKHKAPWRPLGNGAYTTKRYYHDGGSEGNR